jgi:hypothetical protein
MFLLRSDFRIPCVDDKRCAYTVYFVYVPKAAFPQRVGEKYFLTIRQIFEWFASQRRRQSDLHAFAFPIDGRLNQARMKDRSRRGRDLNQMRAAGKQGTRKNDLETNEPLHQLRHRTEVANENKSSDTNASPKRTLIVPPPVVTSAAIRRSTPRKKINTPRSAPAVLNCGAHDCVDQFLQNHFSRHCL